jgi:hypothetical protein
VAFLRMGDACCSGAAAPRFDRCRTLYLPDIVELCAINDFPFWGWIDALVFFAMWWVTEF